MKCPNLHCLHSLPGSPEFCPSCGLPLPGAMLGERFRLERVESASGTAVRFLAHDSSHPASVRIYLAGPERRQQVGVIGHEVDAVRELGSGGMPRVLGADLSGPVPWIATDAHGQGDSIDREMLRQQRPYSEKEVLSFLEDAARTLAPLHAKGIAHRAIRPDQAFRRGDGHYGLGLPAWEADLDDRPPDALRSPYLAPEYASGRATPRTDMYALGVTAIHLLTGLQGTELARAARNPELRADRFGLTAGAFDVLTALLAESQIKRVASGGQLLELLSRADLEVHGGGGGGAQGTGGTGPKAGAGGELKERPGAAGLSAGGTARPPRHRGEPAGGQERRRGLAASLLALLALLGRGVDTTRKAAGALSPALRARILVAIGLGVAAAAAGGGILLARGMAGSSSPPPELVHSLPTPVVGRDDSAVAGAEAGHRELLARAGRRADPPADPPALEVIGEIPVGREPVGTPPPAGTPGAAISPPGGSPGKPNAGFPAPKGPGDKPGLRPGEPVQPYDEVAEPGTDPDDASGLGQKSEFFIRVNKTYKTLTLYHNGQYATQYVVAIGARANTPDGRYAIKKKIANPSYENVAPGDPRNPLGTRWLGMDVRYPGGRSIGIHGTNNESSLGQAASGGCIRMKNSEVEQLFDLVPEGTPVEIN